MQKAKEAERRMVDRKRYSGLQIGRWGRLYAKLLVIAMEDVLGEIINRQPHLRKVFAAAFKQGLQPSRTFHGGPRSRAPRRCGSSSTSGRAKQTCSSF